MSLGTWLSVCASKDVVGSQHRVGAAVSRILRRSFDWSIASTTTLKCTHGRMEFERLVGFPSDDA